MAGHPNLRGRHAPGHAQYGSLDLAYHRIVTNTGGQQLLNAATFGASGKGPVGAAAFVWDDDCDLWLHEHGLVHASAKLIRKIRCSGMIIVQNVLADQFAGFAPMISVSALDYFSNPREPAANILCPCVHKRAERRKISGETGGIRNRNRRENRLRMVARIHP